MSKLNWSDVGTIAALQLTNDDGTIFGNDTSTTQGTSFAAPIVSGVVALMLEANPNLGYRDVQQILALTSKAVSTGSTLNLNNGSASTIAGRGLTVSGDVENAFGGDGNDKSRCWRDGEWWLRPANDPVFDMRRKG